MKFLFINRLRATLQSYESELWSKIHPKQNIGVQRNVRCHLSAAPNVEKPALCSILSAVADLEIYDVLSAPPQSDLQLPEREREGEREVVS